MSVYEKEIESGMRMCVSSGKYQLIISKPPNFRECSKRLEPQPKDKIEVRGRICLTWKRL